MGSQQNIAFEWIIKEVKKRIILKALCEFRSNSQCYVNLDQIHNVRIYNGDRMPSAQLAKINKSSVMGEL